MYTGRSMRPFLSPPEFQVPIGVVQPSPAAAMPNATGITKHALPGGLARKKKLSLTSRSCMHACMISPEGSRGQANFKVVPVATGVLWLRPLLFIICATDTLYLEAISNRDSVLLTVL
jgi:hypothetical protein